jgi:muconolactone D-isomerase
MEFLTRVTIDTGELVSGEREALLNSEAQRARELFEQGHLVRVWRPVSDKWMNIGLWQASDEAELTEVLDSLPLRPFMSITIERLLDHPNDPARMPASPDSR